MRFSLVILALVATSVVADIYMHNPRGSNNRLNEANAQRNNGNRMFDSQNNNRGGVNVGVRPANSAGNTQTFWNQPNNIYNEADKTTDAQYPMVFYENSILQVEYNSQHGCGGNERNDSSVANCHIVMQYMCDSDAANIDEPALQAAMRDGTNTNTVNTDGSTTDQGMHESAAWYQECQNRQRNRGLFTADQNLNGNTAIYTRQNPNGGRSGLECAEERDYYPYWLPTPWRDVAYLTSDLDRCGYIVANSQNTARKFKCASTTTNNGNVLSQTTPNTCADAGGVWKSYTWNLPQVDCRAPQWTRHNHLGNARQFVQMANYNWTLPSFADLTSNSRGRAKVYDTNFAKCVFRIRYNISTDDYDPWNINATWNGNNSPVRNNPTVNIGSDQQPLRLAIDTDQFGRTFQDRTHIFYIRRRPTNFQEVTIWNLNVRGKRGNIVQTFPSLEYDFVPNRLHISTNDLIHIQWTGSNTHNNGGDGGDGQTGDAGQGTGGTDRSNLVPIYSLSDSYPIALDKDVSQANLFAVSNCYKLDGTPIGRVLGVGQPLSVNVDCALVLATSGYYRTPTEFQNDNNDFSPLLNNAPPSLLGGVVLQVRVPGTYSYMSTRNHNFSNRDQKGTIIVSAPSTNN